MQLGSCAPRLLGKDELEELKRLAGVSTDAEQAGVCPTDAEPSDRAIRSGVGVGHDQTETNDYQEESRYTGEEALDMNAPTMRTCGFRIHPELS